MVAPPEVPTRLIVLLPVESPRAVAAVAVPPIFKIPEVVPEPILIVREVTSNAPALLIERKSASVDDP